MSALPRRAGEPSFTNRSRTALGESGSFRPKRNNPVLFDKYRFITGVEDGFVKFDYHGKQPELIRRHITIADMLWAAALLGRLSDRQWADAFRAAGYTEQSAAPFINKIKANIAMAQLPGWSTR